MPKKEMLSAITPNRYYHLEAILKYVHQTQTYTTAIIEQNNVQKRIKFPRMVSQLQEGAQYSFEKCFYSPSGWIKVNDTENIKLLEIMPNQFLTLAEIYESRKELNGHYITTVLEIVEISPTEKKIKNGKQLTLNIIKGFADSCLIDLTAWNIQMPSDLLGKPMVFEGLRIELLTHNAMTLVSTVYTKIHEIEESCSQVYDRSQNYKNLSEIYAQRTIAQSQKELMKNKKVFSIIFSTVSDILIFDYEGCSNCKKKLEESSSCKNCGPGVPKTNYWVAQLLVKDQTGQMVMFAFNQKILGALRLARKGSQVRGRVKSRMGEGKEGEKITSNVLGCILSIQY